MIDVILVVFGIVLMLLSIYFAQGVYKIIRERKIKRTWLVLFCLIVFFLLGYVAYAYIIISAKLNITTLKLVVGIIFFTGALFVLIMMLLNTKIIKKLQKQSGELSKMNILLEEKVKERTKQLERSNKLKDLMISILDHDLKNPLTSIKGFSDLASSKTKSNKINYYFKKIKDNAVKMIRLISDARTFSMIEAFEKKKVRIDLNKLINSIIPEFQIKSKQKNIKIVNNEQKAKKHIIYASSIIKEVFHNLIDNAIKYSQEKTKISITIDEPPSHLIVSVSDQGKGVKDKYKEMIFSRFERADAEEAIEGSGLGLAICKQIIKIHKGKIWVEDNPSGGSIFKVELPKK